MSILNSQLCNISSPCQAKNYFEALQWYNYSLSFYKAGQMEPNLAKLQRNRASCLLLLKQLDKVTARETQSRLGRKPCSTSQLPFRESYCMFFSWVVNKDTIISINVLTLVHTHTENNKKKDNRLLEYVHKVYAVPTKYTIWGTTAPMQKNVHILVVYLYYLSPYHTS